MADFIGQDLSGAQFIDTDLNGARFTGVNLAGSTFHGALLTGVTMRGVVLDQVHIHAQLGAVVINGVDIGPLVSAELDRRHPDRVKMRPVDAAGFREGWDTVERLWAGTVERARTLKPDQLHESVDNEWSFIETLRHLAFATDSWLNRAIGGDPAPWHPLDLPWDEMPDTPGVPRDRAARPSLDAALELRHSRMADVRAYLATLTDQTLAGDTTPVHGPGWPEPRSYPIRECLLTILNEEWEHRLYAERDLTALGAG
jgi:uncharacterized protein YjbI with pentapeptide repeats